MVTPRDPGPRSSYERSVTDLKRALRARMRTIRGVIGSDNPRRLERSGVICARVIETVTAHFEGRRRQRSDPSDDAGRIDDGRIMVYEALPGEPDLSQLVEWSAAQGVFVYLPEVDGDDLCVQPGALDPRLLEVVVVPGVAFTRSGLRLGQGGGHFDRFLPRLAPTCLRIGVAFREQLVDQMPTEPHDVALDVIVTDE